MEPPSPAEVDALLASLAVTGSASRAAYARLFALGSSGVEPLVRALRERSDANVRSRVASLLARLDDPRAVPALADALVSSTDATQRNIAFALRRLRAWDVLIAAARAQDASLRKVAVAALEHAGAREAIPAFRDALRDPDASVRRAAASGLGNLGVTDAIPTLVERLRDDDRYVRAAAAGALSKLEPGRLREALADSHPGAREAALGWFFEAPDDPGVVAHLAATFESTDASVRAQVVSVTRTMRSPEAQALVRRALHDPAQAVRARAVTIATNVLGGSSQEVRAALDDPHPYVRAAAVHALGHAPEVIDTLIARLSDPDRGVRDAAAHGLSRAADARALGPLLDAWATTGALHAVIATARVTGTEPLVASVTARDRHATAAAHALGGIGADEATAALRGALDAPDDALVQAAAAALGQIRAPSAVEPLVARLTHPTRNVRFAAVEALGRIRGARAVAALLDAAARPDGDLRTWVVYALARDPPAAARDLFVAALAENNATCENAARALARLRDRSTVGALVTALQRQSGSRRVYLADALGALGDPAAVDVLCRELASERSGHPRVDLRAANALGRIGDPRAIPTLVRAFEEALAFEDLPLLDVTARALGRLRARDEVALLTRALSVRDDSVQQSVVWALGRTAHPVAADVLAEHLRSAPHTLYGAAACALCEVAPAPMSSTLVGLLRASDHRVRNAAGRRLAALGEPVLGDLAWCLRHGDVRVRRRAAWALRAIGTERARAILDPARGDPDVKVRARAGVRRRASAP